MATNFHRKTGRCRIRSNRTMVILTIQDPSSYILTTTSLVPSTLLNQNAHTVCATPTLSSRLIGLNIHESNDWGCSPRTWMSQLGSILQMRLSTL